MDSCTYIKEMMDQEHSMHKMFSYTAIKSLSFLHNDQSNFKLRIPYFTISF
jgi:hypothetical protein